MNYSILASVRSLNSILNDASVDRQICLQAPFLRVMPRWEIVLQTLRKVLGYVEYPPKWFWD